LASKRKTLLQAARAQLLTIKKTAGYHNDVREVYRGLKYQEDLTGDKMPCLCFSGTDEQRQNASKPYFRATVTLDLVGYVKLDDATDSLQDALEDFIEDVTKALEADRTLGNEVSWLEIRRVRTDRGDAEPIGAFAMEVVFNYAALGTEP
jgi:hypothetical protein